MPTEPAAQTSPMDELKKDPQLGPLIATLTGAKLHEALKARSAVEPNATRRRLLEEVLGNRRWFLEPLKKAPTMSTVNGIGTKLYGESEREADGTYVSTLFFCFFFIPIVPIAQYLVKPAGGRKWSFYGKVPASSTVRRWRQAVALGAALAAVGIGVGVFDHAAHSDVHFVNALDVPVKIHAGKLDLRLAANSKETRRLSKGQYQLKVTTDDGRLLEEEKVAIPGATDLVVYNVLGAAPLYREPITYYAAGHEKEDKNEPIFDAGKRLIVEDHIDYVFSEPPKEISMSEGQNSVRRWRFDQAQGGWKLSAGYFLAQKKPADAVRLAEAVAQARPDDEATLETVATVVEQAQGNEALVALSERLAQKFPDAVESQRLYQSMMMMVGRREEVLKKYRDRAAAQPESATAGYLAARLDLPADALPRYDELAKKYPNDARIRRGLAWVLLQLRRFPEAVTHFEALAKLPHRVNSDELEGHAQALLAVKRAGDAARMVADHAKDSASAKILSARVATRAGTQAPFPPDPVIEDKGQGRTWYEAELGPAGAFEKLAPLDGPDQAGLAVVAAARKSGAAALTAIEAATPDSIAFVPRSLALLVAAQALKKGGPKGKERATHILDQLSPPARPAERDAVLDGKDSAEASDLDLDTQSALELARAWRSSGAEAKKLSDQARSDDLLHGAVTAALAWK